LRVTLGEVLRAATDYLARKGVDSARPDAERLLARALGLSRIQLYTEHDRPLTEAERATARVLVERRGRREPLAYVLGDWDFRRLTLRTDERALVPRPETEMVVADVCTGGGAIALSLKKERPDAEVTATDLSAGALALARENATANGLAVTFVETSLLMGVDGPFDLVVANPPYVLESELDALEPEVRDWEPRLALLDAGQTGALAHEARRVLVGPLVLEVHTEHAERTRSLLDELGYLDTRIEPDLAGRPRIVEGRWQTTSSS
jgi:release factor glutamine methyltransferase